LKLVTLIINQGVNVIINGDCLEVLKKVPVGKAKCIFADPPDNIGEKYGGFDDKRDMESYYQWLHLLILEALPKCKVFWLSFNALHDLEVSWMVRDIIKYRHPSFESMKFLWTYTFSMYNDKDCAYGYRPIIRLKRKDAILYPDRIREVSKRQLLGDSRAAGLRVPSNVWPIPRVVGNSPERCNWMPNQHPIKLLERIISFSVGHDELIIDLFGGSGSALRATQSLNEKEKDVSRKCIVIEQDTISCQQIAELTKDTVIIFDDMFDFDVATR
jgi:DNA modification methylase